MTDSNAADQGLIPPDYDHCQCWIKPAHNAFKFGPRPKPQMCGVKPAWLVVEIFAGKDGKHGAMTVCNECVKELMKDRALCKRIQLQPILSH